MNLNSIDETTEIVNSIDDISDRLLQEIYKTKERIDICIKCANNLFPSLTTELVIKSLNEIRKNRKIKSRCIIGNAPENTDCYKKLSSLIDEVRFSNAIETSFFINETTYTSISIIQKANIQQQSSSQLIISGVKSFVTQQKYFFDLLWDRSTLEYQTINENGIGKTENEKEIPHPITFRQSITKTKVLENPQEIFKAAVDFYRNSHQLKFCSPIEAIKIIYSNFFNYHQEILDRYRKGNHKGIRWITSLNNKKDVELVKAYIEKGIEVRNVKDLLTNSFSLSDKAFLFTIGKIEEKGTREHSILISNDKSYLNQYDDLFENLWKKGTDIHERIKDIEEGYNFSIETISNPKESLNFSKQIIQTVKSEILIMFASSSSFFRFENNIAFNALKELPYHNIKVKILIPVKIELFDEIKSVKIKYPQIEFRILQNDTDSFIGITIIDKQRVLIYEVKDDTKINYIDTVGMTIYIEGKYTAKSYATIFNSLWKQTEIFDEIKKAYEKIENHDKMQKEFIEIAAHELKTPIQPILGISNILKNRIKDDEQIELLDVITRNAKRLKKLSEDILDVSKIESNLLNLNKEHIALREIIQNTIDEYKNELLIKNINIEFSMSDDFVIYADKSRIGQVVSNLINNSIKFIHKEKDGDISITVEKRATYENYSESESGCSSSNHMVVITIKDNGIGIEEENLQRLFTKFTTTSFQGMGLGLYISKNIVEAHGGRIWAENNKHGEQGVTFGFSLPLDGTKIIDN
jgi:signal transduction histidine kinase